VTVHLPRLRTVAIPMMFAFTTLMVAAGHAHAADIDPVGIGDLLPSPDSKVPKGEGTLYETYSNPNLWQLDSDFGKWDVLDPMAEAIADICMALITVIGTACVVIVQWIFQLTSIPALSDALEGSIGGAAKGLSATLLPTALAVGGFVAFTKHKEGGGGGGLSQIAWVFISGVVSVSLLNSPGVWVDGVDSTRQIGANIAMSATSEGIGGGVEDFPFKMDHKPKYTNTGRDDMLRKSSDAVWRAYVATPWCVAEFGSFEVCEKYGPELLNQGPSKDKRKEWLQDNVTDEAVGGDSVKWRQGHSPVGRIMVTLPSLIVVVIFAVLVLALAFASIASLLGALMLLVAGVFFACLWVIPGRPREWGVRWFDQLLGLTLQSFIVTMVLGCVLVVQVATTKMFGEYGWAPSAGLSIAAAIMAFRFRKIIEAIVGVSGQTSAVGGMVLGMLASRAMGRALPRGGRSDSGQHNRPVETRGGRGRGGVGPGSGGGGGGGGGGGALPPGGDGDGYGVTVTRVPFRRPAPPPLPTSTGGPAGVPGGERPALAPAGARPDGSTITVERADTTTGTATGRPLPSTAPRPRPALPGGGATSTTDSRGGTATATLPPGTRPAVSPRPADAGQPNYAFRTAPQPGAPGPKVIEAKVIRSTPNGPPPRPAAPGPKAGATQPPPPARSVAPINRRTEATPPPAPRPAPARDVPRPRTDKG
jgi:hypothetical protein